MPSWTPFHATNFDINQQDGSQFKFILVQLPEPTGRDDYKTIADITKECVRRAVKRLNDEEAEKPLNLLAHADCEAKPQDRGFKGLKLAPSNFKPWQAQVPQAERAALRDFLLGDAHLPEPEFEITDGFVIRMYRKTPKIGETGEVKGEVTGEVRKLILAMQGVMTRREMQESLALKGEENFQRPGNHCKIRPLGETIPMKIQFDGSQRKTKRVQGT